MTREEVTTKLKQYLDSNTIEDITGNEGITEAISIAIEVLEQQEAPMKTVVLELTEEDYQRIQQQMKTAPLVIMPPKIIRCEECRYYRTYEIFGKKITLCKRREYDALNTEPDDFCSRAERREG